VHRGHLEGVVARQLGQDRRQAFGQHRLARPGRSGEEQVVTARRSDFDGAASGGLAHHVEEIPPGYSHALLLRGGQVVASGAADDVLTAANLSETFGLSLTLTRTDGRFAARRAA
jgi:hypothetical protein